jgi:hypothetical protein
MQGVHAFDCDPDVEYVPAKQSAITASDVGVQATVTRCPAPATEHAVQDGFALTPVKK